MSSNPHHEEQMKQNLPQVTGQQRPELLITSWKNAFFKTNTVLMPYQEPSQRSFCVPWEFRNVFPGRVVPWFQVKGQLLRHRPRNKPEGVSPGISQPPSPPTSPAYTSTRIQGKAAQTCGGGHRTRGHWNTAKSDMSSARLWPNAS